MIRDAFNDVIIEPQRFVDSGVQRRFSATAMSAGLWDALISVAGPTGLLGCRVQYARRCAAPWWPPSPPTAY